MCIIAVQPRGSVALPYSTLDECWKGNSHGAGYMFAHNGEVQIRKAFFSLDAFVDSYRSDIGNYGKMSPFVLHCRWATHGSKNILNTHPHPVIPGDVGLVHNGVFQGVDIPADEDISDTIAFIRQHLSWRKPDQLLGRTLRKKLGRAIGYNKLVMLRGDGKLSIVNAHLGEWEFGGVWYSNTGYLPSKWSNWNRFDDDEWEKGEDGFYRLVGKSSSVSSTSSSLPVAYQKEKTPTLFPEQPRRLRDYTAEYFANRDRLARIDDTEETELAREELAYLQLMEWDELAEEDWNRRHQLEDYFDELLKWKQVHEDYQQEMRGP